MRLLLNVLFCFCLTTGFGQFSTQKWYVGGKASYGLHNQNTYFNVGFTAERIFEQRFGLIYNLEYQHAEGFNYLHGSVGTVAGPPLILLGLIASSSNDPDNALTNELGKWSTVLGVMVLAMPDGVSYHIPLSYHWDLAPYLNVLGIDYVWNRNENYRKWKYSASIGSKITYWNESGLSIAGFIEGRKTVSFPFFIGAGLNIGYAFGSNRRSAVFD